MRLTGVRRVEWSKTYEAQPKPEGPYYSPKKVARELDVDLGALYTQIEEGTVNVLRIRYRRRVYVWIHKDELERLKEERINKLQAITAESAAEQLGIPLTTLLNTIRHREIKAIEFKGKYYISPKELGKLKSRGGKHAHATTV